VPDCCSARWPGIDTACRSPNHGSRIGYDAPDSIVLHYTGMVDGPAAIRRLCDPSSQVSCHYVVTEAGDILQLVAEDRRAWHAGRSFWQGVTDMNSASIGIEIVNGGHDFGLPPFPDAQIDAVIRLCREVMVRHGIQPERVLAHSDIAPGRKRDPGEVFPWRRLAAESVGVWPVGASLDRASNIVVAVPDSRAVRELQGKLARYGYGLSIDGVFGPETKAVIEAFQRHFRPERIDGEGDGATIALLDALLAQTSV
jgi:N-acetylmuramoyl-L-alanine amidase